MLGHGDEKFPAAGLLSSSATLGWDGILIERRAHRSGEIPAFVPRQTEVTTILRADHGAAVVRRGNGRMQNTAAVPGATWLCPVGVYEDCIRITHDLPEVLHMYIPDAQFEAVARDHGLSWSGSQSIRYEAGLQDPLIEQIGRSLLAEVEAETAAGSILASTLACSLAARLMSQFADVARAPPRGPTSLDAVRLRRVLEFIDAHLQDELRLADLARVVALSQFHFLRAFKTATGVAPYNYVSARRLELARRLLAEDRIPLVEVALTCKFSSQANFSRAFRRATGITPGSYRRQARENAFQRTGL